MSKECSFDVASKVDLQEVDNAINQATREIAQRFDFKGSRSASRGKNMRSCSPPRTSSS